MARRLVPARPPNWPESVMAGNDTGHRRAGGGRPQVPPVDGLNCHLGLGQPGQLVLILAGNSSWCGRQAIWWPDNHYQTTVVCCSDANLQPSELAATTYMTSISLFPYFSFSQLGGLREPSESTNDVQSRQSSVSLGPHPVIMTTPPPSVDFSQSR